MSMGIGEAYLFGAVWRWP